MLGAARWSKLKPNFDNLQDGHSVSHAVIALHLYGLYGAVSFSVQARRFLSEKKVSRHHRQLAPHALIPRAADRNTKVSDLLPTYLILSLQACHRAPNPA